MSPTAAASDAKFDAVPTEHTAPFEMAAPSSSDVPLPAASSPSDTAGHGTSHAMSMVRRDDGLYFEFYGLPLEPLDFSAAGQTGGSGQGTSQSVLHSPPAPHEREPVPWPVPIATTKPAERKPSPLRGPGPAEVAKSLTDASAHFERYQDCLIKNFVGEHRLRLADASRLADANIRDWEDLKCISAHIKGLVDEAERELREKEQEATSIADAQTESNLGQTIRSSSIEASLLPMGHHSPRADERTEESPDPKQQEEECRRYRSLAGARAARTIRQEREALHQMAARAGGNARGYTCHGEVLACPRQSSQAPVAAVQAKQPRAPLVRAHPSRRERCLVHQQAVAQTKEPLGQGACPDLPLRASACAPTDTARHPAHTSVMIDLRPPTKLEYTPARLSASASSPAFHHSENLSRWNPSLPCVNASLPGWSAARVMTGVCGHADSSQRAAHLCYCSHACLVSTASRYAAFSGVRLADRPQCWNDPPSGLRGKDHMWFESVLSHEVIEYNAIRIQCAWRVKVARLQWRDEVALPAQLAHDEDRRAFEAALDESDEQLKIILPPLPLPPENSVDEIACSGSERERRYGTESDNQYVPPSVQVLPIPPPFVPPDFDGMYKMRTLYTKRLDDVNNALNRARAQVRLYDQLRQDTLGRTTGVGGVIAQALGTVDNLEQLRDSTIPGRRIYTDRHITRSTVANAYNSVMAQAGLTPEPTAGVTKSVLIDRIIDAGVDPNDLRDVIMSSYQPFVPPPDRTTSTRTPRGGSSSGPSKSDPPGPVF
ncbi:hypothetical protein AB1Y20_001166 [Prymnesium parvum]|uniref:Uncharacterized protein n=1 Tax=Prymnesium parvum TaxID=97485 RepID=A0AB34KBS2_PRYPA